MKLARFIKIEFNYTSGKKPLKLKEVKINKAVDYSVNISNIKILNVKEHSVQIYWETDIETTSQIRYGINNTGNLSTEMTYRKKHIMELDKLLKGTLYYYNVVAVSLDKKVVNSKILTFTTKGIPLPLFESVTVKNINWDRSELNYKVNVPVKAEIKYGNSPGDLSLGRLKSIGLKKENKFTLKDLKPLKRYYYHIDISDKFKNRKSAKGSFVSAEKNIALGKKVEGTFNEKDIADKFTLEGDIIGRITDGSLNYKTGMAVSGDPAKEDQYFIINLGASEFIDKVLFYFRALCYPKDFSVSISSDKKKWKKIKKNANAEYGGNGISDSGDPLKVVIIDVNGEQTQYIKCFIKKGSKYYKRFDFYKFIQIFEVKVYPVIK